MRSNLFGICFIILGICYISTNNEIISGLVPSLRPSLSQQNFKTTKKITNVLDEDKIRYLIVNENLNDHNRDNVSNLSSDMFEVRGVLEDPNTDDNIDDFTRKDQICINYIEKFLGGATDTKDECEVR